jgi:crotonobetainyl-CoA:carnitine CoA-transferase CaiB-like acyl-CoA transferase
VPCGRVRSIEEVLQDPQLAARNMLLDIPLDGQSVKVPGNPIKLSGVRSARMTPPPALGQHTAEARRAKTHLKPQN